MALFPQCADEPNRLSVEERDRLLNSVEDLTHKLAWDWWAKHRANQQNGSSGVTIEDMQQEAVLGAMEAAGRFRPEGGTKFSTYAYVVISAHLADYLRESYVMPVVGFDYTDVVGQPPTETDETKCVELDEIGTMLLNSTDGEVRRIIEMIVLKQMTPCQVAEVIGKPVRNVKLIIRNACTKLQGYKSWLTGPDLFTDYRVEEDSV